MMNLPTGNIRLIPKRGGKPDVPPEGLHAIINDAATDGSATWSLEGGWAAKAFFNTGLRPNELDYLTWEDVLNMLDQSRVPGERAYLTLRNAEGQEARRLLTDDAVKFFEEYRKVRDDLGMGGMKEAFRMPQGLKGSDAVAAFNKEFADIARKPVHNTAETGFYGEELLRFYEGNGNFAYVFRLSKANQVFEDAGKGVKGVWEAMKVLGHASDIHTSRYISLAQHGLADMDVLLKEMGLVTAANIAEQSKNLNEGAWRAKFTEDDLNKLGQLDIWNPLPSPRISRKGYSEPLHAEAVEQINHARKELLAKMVDLEHEMPFDIPKELFSTMTDPARVALGTPNETQYETLKRAINSLDSLQIFTQFLTSSIIEKNMIKNSREAVEGTVDSRVLNQLKDRATEQAVAMEQWFEPILELVHSHMSVIDNIFTVRAGVTDPGDASWLSDVLNTRPLQRLKAPFDVLGWAEIKKKAAAKKGGVGGGQRAKKLSSLPVFQSLFYRAVEAAKVPLKTTGRKRAPSQAAKPHIARWAAMNPEERKAAMDLGTGYLIRPLEGAMGPGGEKLKAGTLWIITDFIRTKPRGAAAGGVPTIKAMQIEQLAARPMQGEDLVRAKVERVLEIPILVDGKPQFDKWNIAGDGIPFSPALLRSVTTGGPASLTEKEVAHALFEWRGNPNRIQTKHDINVGSSAGGQTQTWRTERLLRNEIIKRSGSKGTEPTYIFSEETRRIFNEDLGGINDDTYGWAKLAEEGGGGGKAKTPAPPASSTPDPGIPPGMDPENKIRFQDQDGEWHDFVKRVTQPRSMMQKMTYRGGAMMYAFFKKMPPESHKLMRMLVPGTFAASTAARLRWTYIFSKAEGRNVASDIGHMLDELHSVAGSNRRNGRGSKLAFADGLGAIDPKTGHFRNPELLKRDYNRSHGVKAQDVGLDAVVVDEDLFRILAPTGGAGRTQRNYTLGQKLEDLRLGPLAVMEETFKKFAKADSKTWTPQKIASERRKFNHAHSLQDLSTFLATHRDDLDLFYKLTPQQQKMYDWYHQIQPILLNVLEEAGYDILSKDSVLGVPRSKMRHSFVPHLITEQYAGLDKPPPITKFGQEPTQWQMRQHYWQISGKMEQGQGLGRIKHEIYNTDPILAIQRTAESYYDKIAADRFLDEFAKLGINNTELDTATQLGDRILASRREGGEALTKHYQSAARKYFGDGWRDLPDSVIQQRMRNITEMSVNWNNQKLKNALDYAPIGHEIRSTALPPEASRELLALASDELHETTRFLTVPSAAANMLRILATGADLGVALLHGFGGLGMTISPVSGWNNRQRLAWSRAAINMGKAMLTPNVRREWYKSTQLTRAEMQKYGVAFFRSTHIEDLPLPGLFTKGQLHPNLDKPGMREISKMGEMAWVLPERMINGFGFFLDVSKTEMWKVQSMAIRRHFGLIDDAGNPIPGGNQKGADEAFNDMSASLNAIHGTLEPSTVGIPQKQRNFESAFLLYAALYRRSAIALLKNMTSGVAEGVAKTVAGDPVGGFQAFQARKWRRGPALQAASGMTMAGVAIAWAAHATGNNDDVLDPGSADFMSMKYGNMRIGAGTPFYTYIRLGRDVFDQVKDGDAAGLAEVNFSDNALLKFARSMSSPTTSIGIDIGTGTSFIGDPLRDTTGGWEATKIGDRITRNLMPFWADTLFLDDEVGHKRGALAEFFGLRVSPQAPFGRMKIARNAAILMDNDPDLENWKRAQEKAGLEISGATIPKLLLRQLIARHPDLQALEEEISEDVQWRGSYLRKKQDLYIQEVKLNLNGGVHPVSGDIIIGLNDKLQGISDRFEAGLISPRQMVREKNNAEQVHMGRNQQLADSNSEVIETFEDRRTGTLSNPEDIFVFDLEYDRYRHEVTGDDRLYDESGNFDVSMFVQREAKFQEELSKRYPTLHRHIWKYIGDLRKDGKYMPGSIGRMDDWQDGPGKEYWKLHEKLWGPSSDKAQMINVWRSLITQQEKDYYESKNFKIKFLLQQLKYHQEKLRRNRPDIDAGLVEFYGYKALTNAGKVIERKRAEQAVTRYPVLSDSVYQGAPTYTKPETQIWPVETKGVASTVPYVTPTNPNRPAPQTGVVR